MGGSVVVCLLMAVLLIALGDGSRQKSAAGRPARRKHPHPHPAALAMLPGAPGALPSDHGQLAAAIDRAQAVIDDRSATSEAIARAGYFEQLATGAVGRETLPARRATLAMLSRQAAASMRTNLEAAVALFELATPRKRLPHWRIVQPPAPNTLLGYFRAAQSRFGIRWEYLAAIEFIETRFGRVQGLSSAGARGPMQFLPATWAQYGSGSIDNQRDAILGAARYLVSNGAPGNMADALYHYNNSREYVSAVQDYAGRMRADARALDGYYYWQVLFATTKGSVILPLGYPGVRPVPVAYPLGR